MVEIYKSLPVNGVRRIPYKRDQFGGSDAQGNSMLGHAKSEPAADFIEPARADAEGHSQDEAGYPNLTEQLAGQNRLLNDEITRLTREIEALQTRYSALLAAQTEIEERDKSKGYEIGYRAGVNQAALEAKDRAVALVSAVDIFNYRLSEDLGLIQKDSILLAYEALILIVGEYYKTPEFLNAVLQSAVSKIADRKNIKLHLSNEDYDLVKQMLTDNLFQLQGVADIVSDDRVKKGGCIIETENGIWDARLDSQLERIKDALVIAKDGARK
ncbi:hypothetical protein D0C16_22970 [Cellvibrio sp. KY-GH-1]|uniref:FliH/SctL family protein n=1 Tax=Cellvibrio sp. KY-GH-1 TaxID=2303332 RepID=UPI00124718EB|nr:FliH/SctL family protein [Cellvibrio sp. KY-GH-1]QEY18594.1 hypothetical protein D0C16_22970 [Cellvibrio sp. KY-GH-1]